MSITCLQIIVMQEYNVTLYVYAKIKYYDSCCKINANESITKKEHQLEMNKFEFILTIIITSLINIKYITSLNKIKYC